MIRPEFKTILSQNSSDIYLKSIRSELCKIEIKSEVIESNSMIRTISKNARTKNWFDTKRIPSNLIRLSEIYFKLRNEWRQMRNINNFFQKNINFFWTKRNINFIPSSRYLILTLTYSTYTLLRLYTSIVNFEIKRGFEIKQFMLLNGILKEKNILEAHFLLKKYRYIRASRTRIVWKFPAN